MKRVVITQSNYLPWKGWFDVVRSCDELVLLDEVQYTRRDWRNRNKVKTAGGTKWISVPVQTKGRYTQRIDETLVSEPGWAEQHWALIDQNYRRAGAFATHGPQVQALLERAAPLERLSDVNRTLLEGCMAMLGIDTPIRWSTEYEGADDPTERLLSISEQAGATTYVSGPAAKAYMDVDLFAARGIDIEWFEYGPYPEYEQPHPPFEHGVSVVDLLLCTGDRAGEHL